MRIASGRKPDYAVEVDDHRVEGLGRDREPQPVGDPAAVLVELGELGVLQILVELALGELDAAPGLGDDRQVRERRQGRAQALRR